MCELFQSKGNFDLKSVVPRDGSRRRCIEGTKLALLSIRNTHVISLKPGKRRKEGTHICPCGTIPPTHSSVGELCQSPQKTVYDKICM